MRALLCTWLGASGRFGGHWRGRGEGERRVKLSLEAGGLQFPGWLLPWLHRPAPEDSEPCCSPPRLLTQRPRF